MPSRPAPTARSSSRSSKRSDGAPTPAGLPITSPDGGAVEIGTLGSAHGLRGQLRFWPHQPGAPSLATGRPVLLERQGTWLAPGTGAPFRAARGSFGSPGPPL